MSDTLEFLKKAYILTYKQGRPALNTNGSCVYRTEDGAKCAIGQFISDEAYFAEVKTEQDKDELERQPLDLLVGKAPNHSWQGQEFPRIKKELTEAFAQLSFTVLNQVQGAHDRAGRQAALGICEFLPNFQQRMLKVAENVLVEEGEYEEFCAYVEAQK